LATKNDNKGQKKSKKLLTITDQCCTI